MYAKIILIALVFLINLGGFVHLGVDGDFAAAALVAITVLGGAWEVFHAVVLTLLLRLVRLYLPEWVLDLPATAFLIPFLLSLVLIWPTPRARSTLAWARRGKIDRVSFGLMLLTAFLSTGALILWAVWSNHLGIGEKMMNGFIAYPRWELVLVGIPAFALINALAEEMIYRGVLQQALQLTFASSIAVILLQASAFAAIHVAVGFPNGVAGCGMVFVYGAMLGYLRHRTKGLLAPYLTHVLADLTIGYFLYFHAIAIAKPA